MGICDNSYAVVYGYIMNTVILKLVLELCPSSIYWVYTGAIGWVSVIRRSHLDSLALIYDTKDEGHYPRQLSNSSRVNLCGSVL